MALERGGEAVDDPRAWLDSLPDDVVVLWDAYWQIEPWGVDWQRHAAQMEMLERIYAFQINKGLSINQKHLRYEPRAQKDFMPADYAGERRKRKSSASIAEQLDQYAEQMKGAG